MTPKDILKEQGRELNKRYKKTIYSFKQLSDRKKLYASLSLVMAFAIISALTGAGDFKSSNSVTGRSGFVAAVKTMSRLEDLGTVEKHMVPNATKTVFYVPQIHKEPTSQASDAVNDQAAVIQSDIYKTLDTLVKEHNVKYVMDETDLYGPMPQDKINKIKAGLSDIDELRKSMDNTLDQYVKAGGSQATADSLRKATEQRISQFERSLYLTGGAAVLAATNSDAHVYGSQNAATINQAKKELQDLVYLENRINELQGSQKAKSNTQSSGSQSQQVQKMLSSMSGSGNSTSSSASLNPVYALSTEKNDDNLKDAADDFKAKFNNLSASRTFETGSGAASTSVAPENPYKTSTNLSQLKAEYDQKLAKFMKIAKDQRSQEVADNVVREMDENGQNSAVLVFGAQHKDQIVEALNKKAINVIVVTPPSEVKYLQSQTSTNATIK